MSLDELKAAAVTMLDRAYCPYSHFPVGAAVECTDGTVFTGCNIENAAYRSEDYCYPCGMCRQFMKEFAPEMQVICLNGKGEAKELTLRELLPYGFDSTFLPGEQ